MCIREYTCTFDDGTSVAHLLLVNFSHVVSEMRAGSYSVLLCNVICRAVGYLVSNFTGQSGESGTNDSVAYDMHLPDTTLFSPAAGCYLTNPRISSAHTSSCLASILVNSVCLLRLLGRSWTWCLGVGDLIVR